MHARGARVAGFDRAAAVRPGDGRRRLDPEGAPPVTSQPAPRGSCLAAGSGDDLDDGPYAVATEGFLVPDGHGRHRARRRRRLRAVPRLPELRRVGDEGWAEVVTANL
ncbi:MAG TPA: hypothetical protein VMG12_30940 [Polyangiaceae bacterium]|nr:hypothetical protein [Polyangiaceae bacterium]